MFEAKANQVRGVVCAIFASCSVVTVAQAQTPAATAPSPPPTPAPAAPPPAAPGATPAAPSTAAPAAPGAAPAAPGAAPASGEPLWQPPPAPPPEPETNTSTMNNNLSVFGSIGYGYGYGTGYGLGARYQLVVADDLVRLPKGKRNELGIEFGVDWYHVNYHYGILGNSYDWSYNEFTPVVGLTWNFWLSEKLALYPKLDLGYRFISWNDDVLNGYDPGVGHLYFQGTGGVIYKLGAVSLRAELGWASLRLGAAFGF